MSPSESRCDSGHSSATDRGVDKPGQGGAEMGNDVIAAAEMFITDLSIVHRSQGALYRHSAHLCSAQASLA